jgi:universal stress protein E
MRILCATDLLSKSDAAVERAGVLADHLGADLMMLHIVSPDGAGTIEERLQNGLTQMTARARPPLWTAHSAPRLGILPGTPARMIVDAVQESKARLLVLGPHRRRPVRDVLEGSLVEKALESRRCPVLIVHHRPRGLYRRVLLALDATAASASAVSAAATLVLTRETAAQVVHVYHLPYAGIPEENLANLERDSIRAVRNLLERERSYFGGFEIRLEQGEPAGAILHAVGEYQPDLLVMGTRGMGRLRRAMSTSVANRVLQEIERDVLIVPEGSFVGPVQDRWGFAGLGDVQRPAAPEVRVDR